MYPIGLWHNILLKSPFHRTHLHPFLCHLFYQGSISCWIQVGLRQTIPVQWFDAKFTCIHIFTLEYPPLTSSIQWYAALLLLVEYYPLLPESNIIVCFRHDEIHQAIWLTQVLIQFGISTIPDHRTQIIPTLKYLEYPLSHFPMVFYHILLISEQWSPRLKRKEKTLPCFSTDSSEQVARVLLPWVPF